MITHWGSVEHTAEQVLRAVHTDDLRVPVIIFAGSTEVEKRKVRGLRLGAQGYYYRWEGLRRGIEQVFDTTPENC